MINVFISSLIALFFLGKTTKETREKTARASWFRTFVFLLLTIIFGVIFYKSNQVSTIVNFVDIKCHRGIEDSMHNTLDTIKYVDVYNNFKAMGSYKNDYLDVQNRYTDDNLFAENGGVYVSIKRNTSNKDSIKTKDYLQKSKKYAPFNSNIRKYLKKDITQVGSIYELSMMTTSIPSFIPFYPVTEMPLTFDQSDNGLFLNSIIAKNTRNNKELFNITIDGELKKDLGKKMGDEKMMDNGTFFQITSILGDINAHEYYNKFDLYENNQIANSINILTAADLSQYSYVLVVKSAMPVKTINVRYNIPIEITNKGDGFSVGTKYFSLYEENALKEMAKGVPVCFHVKLPTMANLQQMRSLVLTALVTTLFSLFCTNLFFCLRKRAMKYRLLHLHKISTLKRISKKRVKLYRYFHYALFLLLLSFILFVVCMSSLDKTILVNIGTIEYKVAIIALLIVAILLFISFRLYKFTITPIPKKRGKEKIKEREESQNK